MLSVWLGPRLDIYTIVCKVPAHDATFINSLVAGLDKKKIERIGKLVKSFLDKFPGLIGVLGFRGRQLSMKDLRHSSRKS